MNSAIRSDADNQALRLIDIFMTVCDKNMVSEFDSKDLYNFLNYHLVTKVPVDLALIDILENDQLENETDVSNSVQNCDTIVASTILLAHSVDARIKGASTRYGAKALVRDVDQILSLMDEGQKLEDLRIDSVVGNLKPILDEMEAKLKKSNDVIRASSLSLVGEADKVEEDGFFVL